MAGSSPQRPTKPRVTIGLPVYNGELYLAEALTSLRNQTFTNYVITVADNASTDSTVAIAESASSIDDRVTIIRNPYNVGAIENFNRLAASCQTEYFLWAAHDDLWHEKFLECCVTALDANPHHNVAVPSFAFIDEEGSIVTYHTARPELSSANMRHRLRFAIADWGWMAVYGVVRTNLAQQFPIRRFFHSDVFLVTQFALAGPFSVLPTTLFYYRLSTSPSKFSTEQLAQSLALNAAFTYKYTASYLFQQIAISVRTASVSAISRLSGLIGVWRAAKYPATPFFSWRGLMVDEWARALEEKIRNRELAKGIAIGLALIMLEPRVILSRRAWSRLRQSAH